MFTGIVEEVGSVIALEPHSTGARLKIACGTVLEDAREGSSIAVNGCCLTALDITRMKPGATNVTGGSFSADLAPETLRRTNLGDLPLQNPLPYLQRTDWAPLEGAAGQSRIDITGRLNIQGTGSFGETLRLSLLSK